MQRGMLTTGQGHHGGQWGNQKDFGIYSQVVGVVGRSSLCKVRRRNGGRKGLVVTQQIEETIGKALLSKFREGGSILCSLQQEDPVRSHPHSRCG